MSTLAIKRHSIMGDMTMYRPVPRPSTTPTGVSSYVLNDRLFPVPVHTHSEPGVLCPVCEGSHDPDGVEPEGVASVRYIKVSVPRCTLQPVSRLRAQRKGRRVSGRSPGATESMGLSKVWSNCVHENCTIKPHLHYKATPPL